MLRVREEPSHWLGPHACPGGGSLSWILQGAFPFQLLWPKDGSTPQGGIGVGVAGILGRLRPEE